MVRIFVSIINFNGRQNTLDCLSSLNKSDAPGIELHVVLINNSPQEFLEIDHSQYPKLYIYELKNDKNIGFSGGHNKGIEYALKNRAQYILIMNNDVIVDKNMISELYKRAYDDQRSDIISPKIYFAKGHEFHKDRYAKGDLGKVIWYAGGLMDWQNVLGHHRGVDEVDEGQYDHEDTTEFATGACMLVSTDVFKNHMLDEKYFLYYEDLDLCVRAKRKGVNILFAPKAFMWHKNAASSGGSGSQLQDYYISRNRLLFGMKYAPLRSKIVLIAESLRLLFAGRKWQRIGVRDFYLGIFGKGSFGA